MKRFRSPFAIAAILGVLALVALLAYGLVSTGPDRTIDQALARGERVSAPAPNLPRLEGSGTGSLRQYRGRVVVVNFWASWCKPCRAESPLLQRFHQRIARGGRGTVLGIDVRDVSSDARSFVRRYGLTYPMLRDREGDVLSDYGVIGYPETFVVDRRGRIAASKRGPVDRRWLETKVLPLLGEGT